VDTRERAVMDQLRALGGPFDVSALPVGDFCVAPFVFERKTPGDLAASLADGRFREQRDRMETAAAEGMRPVYLLESRAPFAADERTRGAVCSLAERGIAVIPTRDARDTAETLRAFLRRRRRAAGDNHPRGPALVGEKKLRRSAAVTPATCLVAQLCQVPGISRTYATRIAECLPRASIQAAIEDLASAGGERCAAVLGRGKRLATLTAFLLGDAEADR